MIAVQPNQRIGFDKFTRSSVVELYQLQDGVFATSFQVPDASVETASKPLRGFEDRLRPGTQGRQETRTEAWLHRVELVASDVELPYFQVPPTRARKA
mmetsp:Transcript_52666/g.112643  ORF Transcript_52666/g.112643 Transcript_52666/m.112643 type:complete len:98 (+) Transcript_52666:807-1100(+)